jgi:quercetin dioxygenase-like cupin family protein
MKFFRAEDHGDDRGELLNLTPMNPVIKNVMYITGRKGDQRANHYHKKDTHYWAVLTGKVRFDWESADGKGGGSKLLLPGDIVLSEVLEKHRFVFLEDSICVAMATESRTQELYESDTVRIVF